MAHLTRRGLALSFPPTTAWHITHRSAHRLPTFSKLALKAGPTTTITTTLQPPNRDKSTSTGTKTPTTTHSAPDLTSKQTQHPTTLLPTQRLHRPLSPHLLIYKPQITSVLSVLMRNTGLLLSGAFYLFPLLYLFSPLDLSTASMAASFAGLSGLSKALVKGAVAWVGLFHGLNSLRVLGWGFARGMGKGMVAGTGWGVVLASVGGAGGLVWWGGM